MNEVLLSDCTVIVRNRDNGDITAFQYSDEAFARSVAAATNPNYTEVKL